MISDLELLGAVCLFFFTSTFHTLELASVTIARLVSQEMITFMHCSIFQEAAIELPRAAYKLTSSPKCESYDL